MLILLALLLLVDQSSVDAYCSSGDTDCIRISSYNNKQWATCLSNAEILNKTNQMYGCKTTYCYYQCMLDTYGKLNGTVYGDCHCDTWEDSQKRVHLPDECYSPSGYNCSWYDDCLSKKYEKYDCSSNEYASALKYAQKICTLYKEHGDWFSKDGKQWLDGMRKCNQVSMGTLLRPSSLDIFFSVCREIGSTANEATDNCYSKVDKYGGTSWCDLTFNENMFIFWTLKGSFKDKPFSSLINLYKTGKNCMWLNDNTRKLKPIQLQIEQWEHKKETHRMITIDSRLAESIVSSIAQWLNWDNNILDWFAYNGRITLTSSHTSMSIVVILADKEAVMNKKNTSSRWQSYLDDTLDKFKKAVATNNLPTEVEGKRVWVKSLSACADLWCTNKQLLIDAKKPDDYWEALPSHCTSFYRCPGMSMNIFVSVLFVLNIIMQ